MLRESNIQSHGLPGVRTDENNNEVEVIKLGQRRHMYKPLDYLPLQKRENNLTLLSGFLFVATLAHSHFDSCPQKSTGAEKKK